VTDKCSHRWSYAYADGTSTDFESSLYQYTGDLSDLWIGYSCRCGATKGIVPSNDSDAAETIDHIARTLARVGYALDAWIDTEGWLSMLTHGETYYPWSIDRPLADQWPNVPPDTTEIERNP